MGAYLVDQVFSFSDRLGALSFSIVQFHIVTAILVLMAGVIPAVYAALKLNEHIPTAARLAGAYKNIDNLCGHWCGRAALNV